MDAAWVRPLIASCSLSDLKDGKVIGRLVLAPN